MIFIQSGIINSIQRPTQTSPKTGEEMNCDCVIIMLLLSTLSMIQSHEQ
jgi:hypothetical protein